MAPVFGGAVQVLGGLLNVGDLSFIVPNGGVSTPALLDFYLSLTQTAAALPRKTAFNGSQVLVEVGQTEYGLDNLAQFAAVLPAKYSAQWGRMVALYEQYSIQPQRTTQVN